MTQNVLNFPTIGKAITLEDQGVYFTMNPATGMVHSIFRLDYVDYAQEWTLQQLQKTDEAEEYVWQQMAEHANDTLKKMTTHETRRYFAKPEYAEPKGAWQILRNSHIGFGKFTPLNSQDDARFALISWSENIMRPPVLIVKADESTLNKPKPYWLEN